ncbi:uncharacterized protein LOC115796458 [Archocentrus centrarchus]|uniref:uncharacterized protein LOC115796458 n=1 Tax=Archocentrus centrarchus TaxID=63155 RepID=UPI0011EA3A94|nr:uncharacterized protein LOC115796458 [Archocentrus centrarchus]
MKPSSVSLLLGVRVLLLSALFAASLDVRPNLQQFFKGDSVVSLSCVDDGQSDRWTVKRTRGGHTEDCGAAADFRRVNSSVCVLDLSISSGGNFWCENSSGQKSDDISISVSEKEVILEIPALPVRTGSNVTLHCKTRNSSARKSYFFRDGVRLGYGREGKWILLNVQPSEEGLYWCSTAIHQSSQSRLRVRDPPPLPPHTTITCTSPPSTSGNTDPPAATSPPPTPPSPPSPPSVSVLGLCIHLLVFCPYVISTILLFLICYSRN